VTPETTEGSFEVIFDHGRTVNIQKIQKPVPISQPIDNKDIKIKSRTPDVRKRTTGVRL
jgi:hypothetical protein